MTRFYVNLHGHGGEPMLHQSTCWVVDRHNNLSASRPRANATRWQGPFDTIEEAEQLAKAESSNAQCHNCTDCIEE
ncbi:MAG: hypothetical protein OXD46_10520 [Chloroflexi bacterium]|nr:hypothetical protein [Chloroflexota bacterium]